MAHDRDQRVAPESPQKSESDRPISKLHSNERVPLTSGVRFDQYELIRELGRGGMGAVFLARDVQLGRRVAIKLLAHDKPSAAARFRAEARATARCKHDNIVVIHDVGEAHGHSYMVLEYLEGATLREWMKARWKSSEELSETESLASSGSLAFANAKNSDQSGPVLAPISVPVSGSVSGPVSGSVSATLAAEVITPVVRALVHAHGRGLVHRDLKPKNIMLADSGSIKVLDFGIATVFDPASLAHTTGEAFQELWSERGFQTRAGAIIGTLPYMSPEQWRGTDADIDQRTDVWAVGIILWELVTGQHPLAPLTRERLRTVRDRDIPMPELASARPELGPLTAIIDRCLRKSMDDRLSSDALLEQLQALLPGHARPLSHTDVAAESDNPFVGLAAFQETDAGRFFGRELDIARMMVQLRNHRMVAVTGASGVGKSSLLRAGLIPALKRSGQHWESFTVRPGRAPLTALAGVLAQVSRSISQAPAGMPQADIQDAYIDTLRTQPGYLGAALRARSHKRHERILLFIDQFEELYTLNTDSDTRRAFVACVEGVADDASSPLRVVLSLRSDFLDRVADNREFTSDIIRGMVLLSPMSRRELREALTRPLDAVGHRFETETLIDTMLDALETTRAPLPLLQFTAAELWASRDRDRRRLTQASHDQLGGVAGALATHADKVLTGLSSREQRLARTVFTSLVTDERTRAIVRLTELRAQVPDTAGDALERVVHRLADARLLLIETESERGSTVELSHESLIDRWPKLGQWLDKNYEETQFRARLRAAARDWDKRERTEDLLWRGQAAVEARGWLLRWQTRDQRDDGTGSLADLGTRARDYLQAVLTLATRARRRRRLAIVAAVSLVAVASFIALLAMQASRDASRIATQAERADKAAAEAVRQAQRADDKAEQARTNAAHARNASRMASALANRADPILVLALLRDMEPAGAQPPGWRKLAHWAMHQDIAQVVLTHQDVVTSAVFSPDGKRIVTASIDKAARVWNADGTGAPVVLRGHRDRIASAAYSPDGKRIVTASIDKTARVWNADGTGAPVVLRGHQDRVISAAFSPDGKRIVTASIDKTARVWNADSTGSPVVLRGHLDLVNSAAYSPDGKRIVTASRDKTARAWNADGTGSPVVLRGHLDLVTSASYSPDGERIVTASIDKTARVWNADGTGAPVVLRGHLDQVYSAAFSPDGKRIVTASIDKTARAWNADGTNSPVVLRGHQNVVTSAAFSPDGKRIVTASMDKTARVWNAEGTSSPVPLRGHQGVVYSAAFSPDGERIVTASFDKTARVWNADGTGSLVLLQGHQDRVTSAAFSPDGKRIVTASFDKTARVWNADGTGSLVLLRGHQDRVTSAAFSPDGKRIVTASFDKTARVWNADGTSAPVVLRGHRELVTSAAFSPDGKRIVTASDDKTARVWNADGTGSPTVLRGHQDQVYSAAFSPDGKRIVTASDDTTARVWRLGEQNPDGTTAFVELQGHTGILAASGARAGGGAFSPDGLRVLTISNDKTLRVWNADGTGEHAILGIPELDAYTAAFSPDGTRIVTASHSRYNQATGKTEYWATVWKSFKPLIGPDDPVLWTATRYCPPIAKRQELLGITKAQASVHFDRCQEKVAAAWEGTPTNPR